jgi:hypothetical protein
MTKTHLIEDESLGGVLREYVEVDRTPKTGDIIIFNRNGLDVTKGNTYEIKDVLPYDEIMFYDDIHDTHFWRYPSEDYSVIEPTDIIHVDGERYRMVKRKADVGEQVIVTESLDVEVGTIANCVRNDEFTDGSIDVDVVTDEGGYLFLDVDGSDEYYVLEPLEPVEVTEADASPSVVDMLANLARRVTSLEEQLKDTQSNVESLSYELENAKQTIKERAQEDETDRQAQVIKVLIKALYEESKNVLGGR